MQEVRNYLFIVNKDLTQTILLFVIKIDNLKYFLIISELFNPCPALKHIVYSCAETVRHCFDHRGWERGRQVRNTAKYTN